MLARDIMSVDPVCATRVESVQSVARRMLDSHCGALPVVQDEEGRHLVGIVTDRDLALRVLAPGKPLDTPVAEVMSAGVSCCLPDDRLEDVEEIMMRRQVRRVPVVDTTGRCIGIIALGDIARVATEKEAIPDSEVGRVVERISVKSDLARGDADIGIHTERLRSGYARPQPWPEGSRAPTQS